MDGTVEYEDRLGVEGASGGHVCDFDGENPMHRFNCHEGQGYEQKKAKNVHVTYIHVITIVCMERMVLLPLLHQITHSYCDLHKK